MKFDSHSEIIYKNDKGFPIGAKIYCFWAIISIVFAVLIAPTSTENKTRLLVIAFLLAQITFYPVFTKSISFFSSKTRFIVLGTVLAIVVEGFHMISKPVFNSIRIGNNTGFMQGLFNYIIDLLFTVPAYIVILSVIWYFINKYDYKLWNYIIVMGLAQALGDGGIFFFVNAPHMLVFIPYPMTNYHAMNVIPFLAIREQLNPLRKLNIKSYLVIPVIILTYFICGAIIKVTGKSMGFE